MSASGQGCCLAQAVGLTMRSLNLGLALLISPPSRTAAACRFFTVHSLPRYKLFKKSTEATTSLTWRAPQEKWGRHAI